MQHASVQHNASLIPYCVSSRRTALILRSHRCPKPGLRSRCSAQAPGGRSTPPNEKPRESKGPPNQKPASDKPRGEPNTVPVENAPVTGRPATHTAPKPQPAKHTPPAVSKEIPKASTRPQSPGPKAAAWDQAAAGDWGPVESRPDFIGSFVSGILIAGAFLLTTILFKTIGGYRASHPPKPSALEAHHVNHKQERADATEHQVRTSQPAKVGGQAAQEMSGQDKVAAGAQPYTKQDQEANSSAAVAEGQQQKEGQHMYEHVSVSESDSDSNGAISSFGNGSEHSGHEDDQPAPGKEDAAASHLPTEASHSQQDNQSGDEADAKQASQPSQTHQPSADEFQQPQLPSAYHEPKKAWKRIQRTGHLAPAPGAANLTVEHNFSDEISIDSLKQRVSAAMKASASAADASRHASGWSSAASQAASKAAASAERASTAATKCQTQLQSVTERDTEGLKDRIAAAEAAVQEAEHSAAEAVRLQNEIVQAASMAEGHCDVAKSQSNVAEEASDLRAGDRHGVQGALLKARHQAAEIWQQLLHRFTHIGGFFSELWAAVWTWAIAALATTYGGAVDTAKRLRFATRVVTCLTAK
ncbi:hypothetical protein WJX77_011191 [Trebouxia sp. C0004]